MCKIGNSDVKTRWRLSLSILLAAFGVFRLAVLRDMDGRVLTEILEEDSEPGRREVMYQEVAP